MFENTLRYILLLYFLNSLKCINGDKFSIAHRYGFGSCNNAQEGGMWDAMTNMNLNSLLLLGDNIYSDTRERTGTFRGATPLELEQSYKALGNDPSWIRLVDSIKGYSNIHAIWDDHDYGINDGDMNYEYKNDSLKSFCNFFNIPTQGNCQ
jgi:alkaline phosphatase D